MYSQMIHDRGNEQNIEELIGLCQHLSNDELKELINDDSKIDDMIKDSKSFKTIQEKKDTVMVENRSIAEYNLSLAPRLEDGKEKLRELGETGEGLSKHVAQQQSNVLKDSSNATPETILALLQTAAVESEEESENIAEQFYRKEIGVDNFITDFELARKTMHLRRVKAEKMPELLKTPRGSQISSHGPPTRQSVPYPIGPMNMPYPMNNY